jgi:hypothetical protein
MTMCSGTGLLSHVIERGLVAGSCRSSERARGLAALPVVCGCVPGGAGRGGFLSGLRGGEQVVAHRPARSARHGWLPGGLRLSLASLMGPGCCHEEGTTLGHE